MATVQQNFTFPVHKRTPLPRRSKLNPCYDVQKENIVVIDEDDAPKENAVICDIENSFKIPITPRKSKRNDEDASVTPPKLKCLDYIDASPKTPSSLISKLSLGSPKTCDSTYTPRELFDEGKLYQKARQALHSSVPTSMPGREKELDYLQNFINDCLGSRSSGSLYVSGPPGTGKTAALSKILSELEVKSKHLEVYINCASIKSAKAVYSKIAEEIGIRVVGKSEKDYLSNIKNYLTSKHKAVILVLDEIDQLDSRKQSVLYTIFEWPLLPNSQLILVGMANALDLTDRILPRLQARRELKPKLLHFAPYTKQQIMDILLQRLVASNVSEVFSPAALQLLAGKVSAVSGDIRRALDIGRRVVELAEHGREATTLQAIENKIQPKASPEAVKSVELKEVISVLNNIYGASQNLEEDVDESFPLQQKLLLCSLVLILKRSKNKDVTIGRLHEVYRKVCSKRNLSAVDQSEFVGLCSLVETRGIIRVLGRKEPRLNKVCLEWDEDEVTSVLKDKQLMSSILQDEQCVSR